MARSALRIDTRDDAVRFAVHVQPRASRSEITGVYGESMKVRLEAPPVEGAANAALIELLADALGVSRRNVQIVGGQRSRSKVVEVVGVGAESVRRLVTSGDT
jgi:uncharacterized protein (TIGR00251 family)